LRLSHGQDADPIVDAGLAWLAETDPYIVVGVPYVSPPTLLPLAGALAATPAPVLVLQALGAAASMRAGWLVWRGLGSSARAALAAVLLLPQSLAALEKGQTAPVVAWALAALVFGGSTLEASVALTVACAAKVTPLALLPLVALYRPRVAWGTVGALAVLSALGGPWWAEWRVQLAWVSPEMAAHPDNLALPLWPGVVIAVSLGLIGWRLDARRRVAVAWLAVSALSPLLWAYYAPALLVAGFALAGDDEDADQEQRDSQCAADGDSDDLCVVR